MLEEGADILDVGGESTRPGAAPVSEDEELRRVLPVVEQLAARGALVSIDTYKSGVAREAVARGAQIVNDISGLQYDDGLGSAVAETGAALVLMHNRGRSRDMYKQAAYSRRRRARSSASSANPSSAATRAGVQPRRHRRRSGGRLCQTRARLIRGPRHTRPARRAGSARAQRTVQEVLPEGDHRRRASRGARLGHGWRRRRQRAPWRPHRPCARGTRDGAGRPGRRRHPRHPGLTGCRVPYPSQSAAIS